MPSVGELFDWLLLILSIAGTLTFIVGVGWYLSAKLGSGEFSLMYVLSIITICLPFIPVSIDTNPDAPVKRPLLVVVAGLALMLGAGIPYETRTHAREMAAAKRDYDALGQTPSAAQLAAAPPNNAAAPPAVKPPEMSGKPVDLSSVMGRARALANAWQPEAALLGVEATHIVRGVIQTDAGGTAKLTFGPSAFGDAPAKARSFVVTYDANGLKGGATNDKPGKALVEPMCAPEAVYDLAAGGSGVSLSVRYTLDSQEKAAWFVVDPATPKAKPKAFDAHNCRPAPQRR